MGQDVLQSILEDLSDLVIHPSQLTLEGDVELGVGGFGEVFLAVLGSSDSQTKVAVKQLRIAQAQSARRRVAIRLVRELKVWASVKHPNILKLIGFYLSDNYGCAQFVSAYMANGNVKEYINREKPNLATRLRFVQGIASGMSYLHNCNPPICHGDLKPTNVLVNETPDAVLCDFGLVTFIEESEGSSGLTTSNSSIRYMAPELLEGEAKHTLESDVWAWACTIFEILTDRVPFHDIKGDGAVLVALVQGRHPGSVDLPDSLVSGGHITSHPTLLDLKSIIPDCWIIDSAKRPSSSDILNRLIIPNSSGALDIATASARIQALEDLQRQHDEELATLKVEIAQLKSELDDAREEKSRAQAEANALRTRYLLATPRPKAQPNGAGSPEKIAQLHRTHEAKVAEMESDFTKQIRILTEEKITLAKENSDLQAQVAREKMEKQMYEEQATDAETEIADLRAELENLQNSGPLTRCF